MHTSSALPDKAIGKTLYDLSNPDSMSYRVGRRGSKAKLRKKEQEERHISSQQNSHHSEHAYGDGSMGDASSKSEPVQTVYASPPGKINSSSTQNRADWKSEHRHMREMTSLYEQVPSGVVLFLCRLLSLLQLL